MEIDGYVDELRRHLAAAAEAGDEAHRRAADQLAGALDAATRLVVLDVLAAAAAEITSELAPGSVEVRLRGRTPELVVTPPPAPDADPVGGSAAGAASGSGPVPGFEPNGEEGAMARINLRLPEQLKARVEWAADRDGTSTNAWLVRAAAAALDGLPALTPPGRQDRFTGWAR